MLAKRQPPSHDDALVARDHPASAAVDDASYVALAESHQCTFFTADKRLAAALRGHSDRVRMITEYP